MKKTLKDLIREEVENVIAEEKQGITTISRLLDIQKEKDGVMITGIDRNHDELIIFMTNKVFQDIKDWMDGMNISSDTVDIGSEDPTVTGTKNIQEVTPPGHEKQVKALKKELPKTYKDSSGKTKESNPWAVAWASYNKEK